MSSSTIVIDLCTHLRLLLQSSPDAIPFNELLTRVDAFVLECSASPDSPLHQLENELQVIYHDVSGGHALFPQVDKFLAFLYHLRPVLPSSSIISIWFELVLGPTLREPKLLLPAVNYAKELIISALDPCSNFSDAKEGSSEVEKQRERVGDFRRRLVDLYLLDAFNENSGDDVLEWAELDQEQRDKKACWKTNLEDVLIRVGLERPNDFLTEIYRCFIPTSRLQLLNLLNAYTSQPAFLDHAHILATHPLMTSVLYSLVLDNSSTVASIALTTLIKLLPIVAVKACDQLKRHLPMLLVVLARILCWKERQSYSLILPVMPDPEDTDNEEGDLSDNDEDTQKPLAIREDIQWERLELTFDGPQSKAPSPHRYFTFLYYLFPCNTIRFLRFPVKYLSDIGLESLYVVDWEDALDEDKIRSKSERLLRMHVLHPLLIWREASEELLQPEFWAQYDIPQIVSGATMLDVRNAGLGLRQQQLSTPSPMEPSSSLVERGRAERPLSIEFTPPDPEHLDNIPLSSSVETVHFGEKTPAPAAPVRLKVSLSDMVATSVALRSGLDVEVADASPAWSSTLFPLQPRTRSPSRVNRESSQPPGGDPAEVSASSAYLERETPDDGSLPRHVAEAISGLQREVLLLKNDLNLELWTARENVKHIGRLYKERVLSKNEEFERQGLHNKMKEYKHEVSRLRAELKEGKDQAVAQRVRYTDWNRELQDRITALRDEKKKREREAADMRAAEKEAKDTFAAQGKLLAEASQAAFRLETRIKENAYKVDRLYDYEMQIEQLMKLQRLWESDVQKLNDSKEYLAAFASEYKKMELRLDAYKQTQTKLKGHFNALRQKIARLENELDHSKKQRETARRASVSNRPNELPAEYRRVLESNERLREENAELQEEIEEVKAMVDVLKREKSGRMGLVGVDSPRSSPPLMLL